MQVVDKVDNMDNMNDAGNMVDIDAIMSVAAIMTKSTMMYLRSSIILFIIVNHVTTCMHVGNTPAHIKLKICK